MSKKKQFSIMGNFVMCSPSPDGSWSWEHGGVHWKWAGSKARTLTYQFGIHEPTAVFQPPALHDGVLFALGFAAGCAHFGALFNGAPGKN